MSTPVTMPQMGESITEGTIVRWIKKPGDAVDRDEPLFEISTDKVDAEIPSPAAGVLVEITVKEGETVPVGSVVASIGAAGAKPASGLAASAASASPAAPVAATPAPATPAPAAAPLAETGVAGLAEAPAGAKADGRAQRSSPLVRKIAKEHGVDIGRIAGSGSGGRVTKHDILDFIESASAAPAASASGAHAASARPAAPIPAPAPVARLDGDVVEPMSIMRRKIAEHMVLSKRTSAHVYSVFEVDYSRVDEVRRAKKAEYERQGAKLTFTAFIAKALADTLRRHPTLNASIDGDNVIYRRDVHLGVAVSLDNGLIVPVIKDAAEKSLLGIARAIQDVADRARAKKLSPDEVHGGTVTLTNPGGYGAQFGLPIINQPQVAILAVGTIEKRPVVIDDMIGIRLRGYLAMGFDHRLVDGAAADQFLADLKHYLEHFDAKQA